MIPPVEFLGKTITIYPIMALIGVFVSGIFACKQAVKRGLDDNDLICVLLLVLGVELPGVVMTSAEYISWEAICSMACFSCP